MDPIEVREERVSTGATPVQPVAATPSVDEFGRPVAVPPAAPPVAAAPVAAAPVAAAPVAPVAAGTGVYTSRTGVYPVGYRAIQTVWLIVGIINIILALDFIFRAAGANDTGFANLIFRAGRRLAAPFDGIFNTTAVANGNAVFRWADLLAIAVYSLAAWVVTKIIRIASTPRTGVSTL